MYGYGGGGGGGGAPLWAWLKTAIIMAAAVKVVKGELRKRLRAALHTMTAEQRKSESSSIVQQVMVMRH